MYYRLFDTIVVADRELPFPDADEASDPELEVGESGRLAGGVEDDPLGVLRAGRYDFQYGGWRCSCRTRAGRIDYVRRPVGPIDVPLWHVLERLALPIWLEIAGNELSILHAGAVVLEGEAWLFIGETGAGKSTTVFELMRECGAGIASDEMAVADAEEGRLRTGHPALRLEPGSGAEELAVESGEISTDLEKRWFRFPARRVARGQRPIGGIVRLIPDERDSVANGGLELRRLRGGDALTTLLDQTFEFEDAPRPWRERRFRKAAELAESVPVYEFRYRRSEEGAPTHVEALRECLREWEDR